jgi:tRNA(Arg) A34 adenosine deaminase TadA
MDDVAALAVALEQARIGRAEGGVPIGAALIVDGRVVGAGHNRRVQLGSAIRHGETDALETRTDPAGPAAANAGGIPGNANGPRLAAGAAD